MKITCKIFFIIFIIGLNTAPATGQFFYVPHNDVYSLDVSENKELKLSLLYNVRNRAHLNIGYSPWKHVSISGAYFKHFHDKTHYLAPRISTNGQSFTAAVGLYTHFKNPFVSDFFVFKKLKDFLVQGHLGYSRSNLLNTVSSNTYIDIHHQNLFARWGLLAKYNFLSVGLSAKYTAIDFRQVDATGQFKDEEEIVLNRLYENLEENTGHKFTEVTTRIGIKYRFIEFYFNKTRAISRGRFIGRYTYFEKDFSNFGFVIDLHKFHTAIKRNDETVD